MALKRTFLLGVVFVSLAAAMATIAWVVAFWYRLSPAEEALFVYALSERYAGIFLASFFLLGAFAIAFGILLHYYLIPLRRLVEETTLIATVNPLHRISLTGAKDIVRLVEAINDGADRFQRLHEAVNERIRLAGADLVTERNTLAAIIARLGEGILVCNLDFRILMYNGRARELLSLENNVSPGKVENLSFLGLGRSLFDILDKETLTRVIQALEKKRDERNAHLLCALFTVQCNGRTLDGGMGVLPHDGKQGLGYFFTFKETVFGKGTAPEGDIRVKPIEICQAPYTDVLPAPRAAENMAKKAISKQEVWMGRPEFFDFKLFNQVGKRPELENLPLEDIIYTAFDTETTGLYPSMGDEIISIGAVPIVNGRILREEAFHQMIDPKRYMRAEAVRVHGITAEMLEGKPGIESVMPRFYKFVEGTVLLGHNAAFDMRFLELKEPKTGVRFDNPVLDTLLLSLVVHPHQQSHSLEAIARFMGIEISDRHMALGDAILAGEIFLRFIPLLKKAGILTLKEALIACMETSFSQLKY